MTRKDYVAIAEKIRARAEAKPIKSISEHQVVRHLANDIADVFTADNPRFDRARFLAACGLGEPAKGACSACGEKTFMPCTATATGIHVTSKA